MGYPTQNWDETWIEKNIGRYESISEMWKAYQSETGHVCVQYSFRNHCRRKHNRYSRLTWTEEELQWIKENFPILGGVKCVPEFERKFGKKKTAEAIMSFAHRHGVFVDDDAVEANRNFPRRVPLGTIVDDGDGYLKIKVGTEYSSSGWVRYHRYLYEQKHGKLPKGYKIMFLDGNKQNFSDENMVAVPASYVGLMNKLELHSIIPEINLAGIKWCDLYSALRKKGYRLSRGEFIKEF